ncbi:hypothetical protein Fmac_024952 [Flemingia macrophylla]|uniref:Reverse transcriptase Ty1/copia-type domain-containing protein n=1 Tax=Flemingia macrophylla TaxID=520843 RepID=A0ABD1LQW3_9FABA
MQDEFEMSMMGELKFFLGLQILQSDEGIKLHQTKYTKELLKKFKMEDIKEIKTPMHPLSALTLGEDSPNVGQMQFQVELREVHLKAVKKILRYLKGTINLGLCFKRSQDFSLLGYCDADYVGDRWERKSTSGGCHFMGNCLVSWTSKRQSTIVLSTCEAEYNQLGIAAPNYSG